MFTPLLLLHIVMLITTAIIVKFILCTGLLVAEVTTDVLLCGGDQLLTNSTSAVLDLVTSNVTQLATVLSNASVAAVNTTGAV